LPGLWFDVENSGKLTLKNESAGSSANLAHDGFNSGTSNKTLFAGTLILLGLNILAKVKVAVENSLIEGASSGTIWVAWAADPSTANSYQCSKK
jgi:hypothetical protein